MSVLAYGQTGLQNPSSTSSTNWQSSWLVNLLRSNRLTLLVGAPGAARDAMLHSGLAPLLAQQGAGAHSPERVIRFDQWGLQPLPALRALLDAELPVPGAAPATLADQLRGAAERYRTTIMLVLDGFERHLAQPAQRADVARFDRELAECLAREALPVHMLAVLDDATDPALQRYAQWVPKFGRDWLRLPEQPPEPPPAMQAAPLAAPAADPALDRPAAGPARPARRAAWADTDILPPPPPAPDTGHAPGDDVHWVPDLLLDDDEATRVFAAPPPATPPEPEPAAPAPAAAREPAPARPAPTPAHEPAAPPEPVLMSAAEPDTATHENLAFEPGPPVRHTAEWTHRVEPDFAAAPPPSRRASSRPAWFDAPVSPAERDAAALQQLRDSARRWRSWALLLSYLIVLMLGAWVASAWILRDGGIAAAPAAPQATPPRAAAAPPAVPQPAAPQTTAPATAQATAPAPTSQAVPPPAQAPAPPPVPVLTVSVPPDAGAAASLIDALARDVAAPAGLTLRAAAPGEAALLQVRRADALLAARAAGAAPLQVVAPLAAEQIQVLVRADSPWDYLRQMRNLRLNIGRADGARAATARALYRQMFGLALPAALTNDSDQNRALQLLMVRGGPIDALVVVSESPLLPQLPVAVRRQLRELPLDAGDASTNRALQNFGATRRTAGDRPRLTVMNYLVATGAPPRPHDGALRTLAAVLCRAQPALQARGSPLLRGVSPGQQPAVGWPYLLPLTPGGGCPALPPAPGQSLNASTVNRGTAQR